MKPGEAIKMYNEKIESIVDDDKKAIMFFKETDRIKLEKRSGGQESFWGQIKTPQTEKEKYD